MKPPTGTVAQSPVCLLVRPISRNEIATVKIAPPRMSKFLVAFAVLTVGSDPLDDDERDDPDRDVDVEDPVPADLLGQEAADERADDERDAEDGTEQALVLAALLRGEQVADDRQRDREQRTGADALDAAEEDEHAPCSDSGRTGPSR